jgi:hypothetical protein
LGLVLIHQSSDKFRAVILQNFNLPQLVVIKDCIFKPCIAKVQAECSVQVYQFGCGEYLPVFGWKTAEAGSAGNLENFSAVVN